jgi:hypothetical protein
MVGPLRTMLPSEQNEVKVRISPRPPRREKILKHSYDRGAELCL